QSPDGAPEVAQRERRLTDHGERLAVRLQLARLLGRLDDDDLFRPLTLRPDHLDVVAVTDERNEVARVGVATGLRVDLRDQGADRVDDPQATPLAVLTNGGGDAVGGEDADRALRHVLLVVDEDSAEAF